jgi:hypothetical protein
MADDSKTDYAEGIKNQLAGVGSEAKEEPKVENTVEETEEKETKPRNADGKFKAKEKDDEDVDLLDLADDEPEDEEPDNEPDKRGAAKKIEQLNYEVKNLGKQLSTILAKIEAQGGKPTEKQVEKVQEIAEEIDELKDRDDLEEATVGDLRKLAKKAKVDPKYLDEVSEMRQELNQMKAERNFDRQYPELAGKYEKLVEKAWTEADKRMPNVSDSDPRKIGRVQAYLELLAENAMKNAKAKKPVTKTDEPKPSNRPDTSTKGAQIAGKSPAKAADSAPDSDAQFRELARGIASQLTS